MQDKGRAIRWLACILGCAMGWFCASGCTQPSNPGSTDTKAVEIPAELADGAAIYKASCSSCHDTSRDGAPRLGFAPAWDRRVALGEDKLVGNAIEGLDLMPPRGGNESLTDEQIKDAVRYMMYRAELGIPAKH